MLNVVRKLQFSSSLNIDPDFFDTAPSEIFPRPLGIPQHGTYRRFRALFGISPPVCVRIWNLLANKISRKCLPKYLLWPCLFLKSYLNVTMLSAMAR